MVLGDATAWAWASRLLSFSFPRSLYAAEAPGCFRSSRKEVAALFSVPPKPDGKRTPIQRTAFSRTKDGIFLRGRRKINFFRSPSSFQIHPRNEGPLFPLFPLPPSAARGGKEETKLRPNFSSPVLFFFHEPVWFPFKGKKSPFPKGTL